MRPDGQTVVNCAFCLYHKRWCPVEAYYPDKAKPQGIGSYCKVGQALRKGR